ncbi:hypothetical protein SASPL_105012 [Salvia splendens]|uniref:Exocyst complex component n=1 Tax=Salvia splendens TaxID=180675 RepID=A0A8X8YPP1_SALSN|nr:hypothetical protein SASPL_105012 [Salvia splendens]
MVTAQEDHYPNTTGLLAENNFYLALQCLDSIETEFQEQVPSITLKRMLEKQIPAIRAHIERHVNKEFGDWLVEIRTVSRNLGQLAIGQASAGRQREEELRMKQRQAEEQSRLSLRDCVYALEEEEDDGDEIDGGKWRKWYFRIRFDAIVQGSLTASWFLKAILVSAFSQELPILLCLRFRQYYFENMKLQLTSDFQVSSMTPFLESHQTFFAQIAGFFIVVDRVLRTGGGLIMKMEVESLSDTAVMKMCYVLEDQFSRMQTANHLLLIKDYVRLLGVTLRRFGYPIDALLDVISKHRDKYHELLLSDCRKQMAEALAADKFEQMYMKEYQYSMNVLSFQIQTSNIMPAFPYVAPFSSTVPDCCRIVRSFIEDSVSFMSHGGQLEFHDVVKKYLDRLLTEVLDGALSKVINSSIGGVTQAMQMAANMAVFERASEEALSGLLKQKVDGFLTLMENVNWVADEPPQGGNEYANEVVIFLETLASTAQQILPVQVLKRTMKDVLSHISEMIIGESVKRFNVNAVMGLDVDVRLLESFAENQSEIDASQERSYGALDYRKVVTISEKLRDQSDRVFGTRGAKQNPKKKSLDTLIKRLKDAN